MNTIIELKNLTKDYGNGRGIFDINLTIKEGEMIGFVGTNGSGKTTTIRNILGFIKPTNGHAFVYDLESWKHSSEFIKDIGYVPGEISFPDLKTGVDFLKSQASFCNLKDMSYADYLIKKLQLDINANLKSMSKGMKQKTAIVAALMKDPKIIILDEPTTGLDPLMRDAFLEIISEEHKKGKTIFMSSHMYNELEKTCDKVALISNGHIIDVADMNEINNSDIKNFKIEFNDNESYKEFKKLNYQIVRDQSIYNQVTVSLNKNELNKLFKDLSNFNIKFISEIKLTLEKHFNNVLEKEKK